MRYFPRLLLVLLLMILAAAVSCAPGDERPMTSNQQSFSVPFDPRVAPVYPGSIINDEFRAKQPSIVTPDATYVALDPKWKDFNPGGGLVGGFIDPIREMMYLSGAPNKIFAGKYQDLPLPEVGVDNAIYYRIATRVLLGAMQTSTNADWGPSYYGLLFGEDIADNPAGTALWGLLATQQKASGQLTGGTVAAAIAAYDDPAIVADGEIEGAAYQYLMGSVQSVQPSEGVFESIITLSVSPDGTFYTPLWVYTDIESPIRQVAFAQRSIDGAGMLSVCDYLRVYPFPQPQNDDDLAPIVGSILQLGTV